MLNGLWPTAELA